MSDEAIPHSAICGFLKNYFHQGYKNTADFTCGGAFSPVESWIAPDAAHPRNDMPVGVIKIAAIGI